MDGQWTKVLFTYLDTKLNRIKRIVAMMLNRNWYCVYFLKGEWVPVMTRLPPAPDAVLHLVKCGCAKERCSTNRCQCRKAGLKCTDLCSCIDGEDEPCDNVADGDEEGSDENSDGDDDDDLSDDDDEEEADALS